MRGGTLKIKRAVDYKTSSANLLELKTPHRDHGIFDFRWLTGRLSMIYKPFSYCSPLIIYSNVLHTEVLVTDRTRRETNTHTHERIEYLINYCKEKRNNTNLLTSVMAGLFNACFMRLSTSVVLFFVRILDWRLCFGSAVEQQGSLLLQEDGLDDTDSGFEAGVGFLAVGEKLISGFDATLRFANTVHHFPQLGDLESNLADRRLVLFNDSLPRIRQFGIDEEL